MKIGPVYVETSFHHAAKGLDFIIYGHWLMNALQSDGDKPFVLPAWPRSRGVSFMPRARGKRSSKANIGMERSRSPSQLQHRDGRMFKA